MTIFSDLAASARSAHAAYFGSTVTLAEPGSDARTVPAVLGKVQVETRHEDGREVRVSVRQCRFTSLATVRHDAIVTISGTTWTIDQHGDRQGSGFTATLRRTVAHEVNRQGYRGKG